MFLTTSSPCRDKGTNSHLAAYPFDITGSDRIRNGIIDLGAYEFGSIISVVTNGAFANLTRCSGASLPPPNSFNVSGTVLTNDIKVLPPSGFEVSLNQNSGYTDSIILTQSGGNVTSTTIYVRIKASFIGNTTGNIVISSSGASSQILAISGGTILCAPSVSTIGFSNLSGTSVTLNGQVISDGGDSVFQRGFVYGTSTSPIIGNGTKITSGSDTGSFSTVINSLNSLSTYYFVAYAINNADTTYGTVKSFQTPTNISISGDTSSKNVYSGTWQIVDSTINVVSSDSIPGLRVIIQTSMQTGDSLRVNGSLPSGVSGLYDAVSGVLTITGKLTGSQAQNILRSVYFKADLNSANVTRNISFSLGSSVPFNGHYYEYVPAPAINWHNAKTAAEARNYFGMTGYLATITSASENAAIIDKINKYGWIGASDNFTVINAALGNNTYANQAASEGKWHWVTGPEKGTQFSNGSSSHNGMYVNFNPGEPNNWNNVEHFIHFFLLGKWNDWEPNNWNIQGYYCEYGGMPSDPVLVLTHDRDITTTPGLISNNTIVGNQNICPNATPSSLTGSTPSGGGGSYNYQWLQSTSSAKSGFGAAGGTNNLKDYSPAAISVPTWYRRLVISGSLSDTSSAILVDASDNTKPSVITQNATIYLNASGLANVVVNDIDNGSTDDCGINTRTLSKSNFNCTNLGNNNVYLKVTDVNGNVDSSIAQITVLENIKPNIITKNYTLNLDGNGLGSINSANINNGSTDNCSITAFALSKTSFSCADLGNQTVWLKGTDAGGNSDSASAIVSVKDITKPIVKTKSAMIYLNASGNATLSVSDINNNSTDNCAISQMSLSKTSFSCNNLGNNSVYHKITDVSGNTDSAIASVTVLDTIKPSLAVRSMNLYLDNSGLATITANQINNNSTDNCGIASISISKSSFTCSDIGTTNTIYLRVTDNSGNTDSMAASIIVFDFIPPVAKPRAKITAYLSANGQSVINPSLVDSASTDNCSIANRTLSQSVFTCSHVGNNTITFTVQDQNGNANSATSIIEIRDTIRPTVIVSNQTIYLNSAGTAGISAAQVNNSSLDNCGIASLTLNKTSFSCNNLGQNQVILTAVDVNGNTASAPAIITVLDSIKPVVQAKANVKVYLDNDGLGSLSPSQLNNGSYDNCSLSSLSISKTNFDCNDLGKRIVTLFATDSAGNEGRLDVVIDVLDTIKPTIQANTIVNLYLDNNGKASLDVGIVENGSADNCAVASYNLARTSFDCNSLGAQNIQYTVTDNSGNQSVVNITVQVFDTISPRVQALKTISVYLDANGSASLTPSAIDIATSDNCSIASLSLSKTVFGPSERGTHAVLFSAIDQSGNTSTTTVTVYVLDTIAPRVFANNLIIYLDDNGQAAINTNMANNASADNVGIVELRLNKYDFDCFDLGNNITQLHAKDSSGNEAYTIFNVMVRDTVAPKWSTVPSNIQVGQCEDIVIYNMPTATDNCGQVNIVQVMGLPSGSKFPVGKTTNTYLVRDASGNSTNFSFTIEVLPAYLPATYSNLEMCENAPAVDLSQAKQNITFIGSGVAADKITFNPYQAGAGFHRIDLQFVDSSNCTNNSYFYIKVNPTPEKPVLDRVTSNKLKVQSIYDSYQWYKDFVAIPEETKQTLLVTTTGKYHVSVSNGFNCVNVSEVYGFGVSTNVNLSAEVERIKLYPNPSTGSFTIEIPESTESNTIQVYDATGKLIMTETTSRNVHQMNLEGVRYGTYVIRVSNTNGVYTLPLIIKN